MRSNKNKCYIKNIEILCDADIRAGRRLILEARLKECVEKEDYETCQAIIKSLKK